MKKCPNCGQFFSDENGFCLEDGTPLVWEGPSPGAVVSPSGDMPTQYIPRPLITSSVPVPAPRGNSNVLYLVIGVLATALVGLGAYMFLLGDYGKQPAPVNNGTSQANTAPASGSPQSPAPAGNTVNAANPVSPPPAPVPNVVLTGKWSGEIAYPSGSAFSAQAELAEAAPGQVRGQIVWTLLRTSNPAKRDKIGVSATEFVQGSLDPARRTLNLRGYNKTDPGGIIILDGYRLAVSADGQSMSGPSLGGKTPGRFSLRRY